VNGGAYRIAWAPAALAATAGCTTLLGIDQRYVLGPPDDASEGDGADANATPNDAGVTGDGPDDADADDANARDVADASDAAASPNSIPCGMVKCAPTVGCCAELATCALVFGTCACGSGASCATELYCSDDEQCPLATPYCCAPSTFPRGTARCANACPPPMVHVCRPGRTPPPCTVAQKCTANVQLPGIGTCN
jgi:hypothetical protein